MLKEAIEKNSSFLQQRDPENDIVLVDYTGKGSVEIKALDDEKILSAMTARNMEQRAEAVSRKACMYCGSSEYLSRATGKLGAGRMRFPHETTTDFSNKAHICLRCMLVALFYTLEISEKDGKKDKEIVEGEINGVEIELEEPKVMGETETEKAIKAVASGFVDPALTYNALFGDEKLHVKVSGLNEDAIEKLSLLKLCVGNASLDPALREVIAYVRSSDLFGSMRFFLQILEKLKKEGGRCISHASKYLFTRAYIGKKEEWVALTIAKIASGIIYIAKERAKQRKASQNNGEKSNEKSNNEGEGSQINEEDKYFLKTFAEEVRNGNLTKALAYVSERYGSIGSIPVLFSSAEEKEMLKNVLDEFSFKYEEGENSLNVYADSIPVAEVRLKERYGIKVYEDAHTAMIVMNQDVLTE